MSAFWKRIIFFGDSLTQFGWSIEGCWLAQIADKYQRRFDVINRGFSGYNSSWCNIILPQLFNRSNLFDVELFAIFIGANDSNIKASNPQQHVPLDEFRLNLQNMCHYLMSCGLRSSQILIIGVPPVDEEKWEMTVKSNGGVSSKRLHLCEEYAQVSKSISLKLKTHFVDLYSEMTSQPNWKSFFNDGLHFSLEGSMFVARVLGDKIDSVVPKNRMHYPLWGCVDNDNPFPTLN